MESNELGFLEVEHHVSNKMLGIAVFEQRLSFSRDITNNMMPRTRIIYRDLAWQYVHYGTYIQRSFLPLLALSDRDSCLSGMREASTEFLRLFKRR
jgi:hypothetical protein